MKTFRNIALILLGVVLVAVLAIGITYRINMKAMDSSDHTKIEVVIPSGTSTKEIGQILKDNDLIRSTTFFNIYVKLFHVSGLQSGTHMLSRDMDFKEILEALKEKDKTNPDEISITIKEGVNMRVIAKVISEKTNNSYDSVIEKANDKEYLNKLIKKYWFIKEDILNDQIYYKLEGYLFPETFRFANKDVTVEDIFAKYLDEMEKRLEPYKKDIENSKYSIHQLITLASMIEKESYNNEEYRRNVSSVFVNRLNKNMSLGSDVTTRYALKIDDAKQKLTNEQYNTVNPYNTRVTDGSMNGKLPVGPISTVSISSLKASVYPNTTDYLYFISNIQTRETFFYANYADFQKKKAELASVNDGL